MELIKELHVAAAILIHESKILIARRAPHKTLGGFWEFPGGKIEKGETVRECLKREILEELGIEIIVGNFFMQNQHQDEHNLIVLYSYFCTPISLEIKLFDHDAYVWIHKDKMLDYNYAPADRPLLKKLLSNNNSL